MIKKDKAAATIKYMQKGLKLFALTVFKKSLMAKKPNKAALKKPNKSGKKFSPEKVSFPPINENKQPPAITGILMRNEKDTTSFLSPPKATPANTVLPLRETPGTTAIV